MEFLSFMQVNAGDPSTAHAGVSAVDGIIFGTIGTCIIIIVWLFNREIVRTRSRMHSSEHILTQERDVLEQRIAERTNALIHAQEDQLNELQRNAAFGELSKGLFHDLINPLSSLTLYAERMGERIDISETTQDMIAKIIATSRRIGSYMESVRRALGPEQKNQQTTDLKYEIGIVRDLLGYKARMAGVEMHIDYTEQITVPAHPVRIHQLLLNLVTNAIDACEGSTVSTVIISAHKKNDQVVISVTDTGAGISPDRLATLFVKSFTTKEKGSGLGLMTVKSVVEHDLKGTIAVTSEVGKGSMFEVRFSV